MKTMLGNPIQQGKVCDIYAGSYFLMDRTNRFSVDDANLPGEIPYKGLVLNQMSLNWMKMLEYIVPNHILSSDPKVLLTLGAKPEQIGRVVAVKRLYSLPFECIVRGYYIPTSHSWDTYKESGEICGISLPDGLKESEELPHPIFTPSTKENNGQHDRNISFAEMNAFMWDFLTEVDIVRENYEKSIVKDDDTHGGDNSNISFTRYWYNLSESLCKKMLRISLELYTSAHNHALSKGIILADTKLEFGIDNNLNLMLIDEAFTPDTTRYWSADTYKVGVTQPSLDKQYLRDFVHNELKWHGLEDGPAPLVPKNVIDSVSDIYKDIYERLFDKSIDTLTEDLLYEWHQAETELGMI